MFKTPEQQPEITCPYVKLLADDRWEYGHYDLERKAHKKGVRATMEEALKANKMRAMS